MRIYTTMPTNRKSMEIYKQVEQKNILVTYAEYKKNPEKEMEKLLTNMVDLSMYDCNLIVDSGAYTVWNSGGSITPKELSDFIKYFDTEAGILFNDILYIALDKIPGIQGKKPTEEEMDYAAKVTYDNYIEMNADLRNSVKLMPVFHEGDRFEYLEKYFRLDCKYIGISPSNDSSVPKRMIWLDKVFGYDFSNIHTHGFGVTSKKILKTYPLTTVDSVAAVRTAGYGRVYTPFGTYVFTDRYAENQSNKDIIYQYLKQHDKDNLDKYFKGIGIDTESLIEDAYKRLEANLIYYINFEKEINNRKPYGVSQLSFLNNVR